MILYITFGSQYARTPHPAGDWVRPGGYLTVVGASTWEQARHAACVLLGTAWAFDYHFPPDPGYFPRGSLAVLNVEDWTLKLPDGSYASVVGSERFPLPAAPAPAPAAPGAV